MFAHLHISPSGYALSVERDSQVTPLATLAGGAGALLPTHRPVDALALEEAIERAEDWLMPRAAAVQGLVLQVHDNKGGVREGLVGILDVPLPAWTLEDVEDAFNMCVARAVRPGLLDDRRDAVAALVLLRELAHHGRLSALRLGTT